MAHGFAARPAKNVPDDEPLQNRSPRQDLGTHENGLGLDRLRRSRNWDDEMVQLDLTNLITRTCIPLHCKSEKSAVAKDMHIWERQQFGIIGCCHNGWNSSIKLVHGNPRSPPDLGVSAYSNDVVGVRWLLPPPTPEPATWPLRELVRRRPVAGCAAGVRFERSAVHVAVAAAPRPRATSPSAVSRWSGYGRFRGAMCFRMDSASGGCAKIRTEK